MIFVIYLLLLMFPIFLLDELNLELQKTLSEFEHSAQCCVRKMKCCKQPSEPTNFEVRALLVKCARKNFTDTNRCTNRKRKSVNVKLHSRRDSGKDDDDKQCDANLEVTNCRKKIKLTVKVKNVGMTNCKNQYILIDHVYDSVTNQKQKLLNPYVLKIRQQAIMSIYGMSFQSIVNGNAKEKVYNKQNAGYKGCNTDPSSSHPTCGVVKYNNKIVPYSTGFCCSCQNNQEGKNLEKFADSNNFSGYRVPFNDDLLQKKTRNAEIPKANKNNNYEFSVGGIAPQRETVAVNIPNMMSNDESFRISNDRLTLSDKNIHYLHKRGGQDCSDLYTPPNVNPETYHDSTHCLEFSNIWYTVYNLEKPHIYHFMQIQIFEKYQDIESTRWRDLTKKVPIFMSNEIYHYINEPNTIAINYKSKDVGDNAFPLNYKIHKLLVPDLSNIDDVTDYPELRGGPDEYLVIKETEVQSSGKACDVAGVGYEAFAKQPHRCSVSKGSCLKNQPLQMWKHDREAERKGNVGNYFLKYFGLFPELPITIASNNSVVGQNITLKMFFTECHTSILDIQFKADHNIIIRKDFLAMITEVYVDSSSSKKTSIIAKVFNSGLVASVFKIGLADCPIDLPASFSNIHTKPVLIPPQRQHIFVIEVQCPLPKTYFFCSLQVINLKNELVAFRKIRMQKLDRCICVWHCSCVCLIKDKGLKCNPLSIDLYHAAGFQGSLPVPLHVVHYTFLDDMVSFMLYVFLLLFLTLLVMGLIKAIVGIFIVIVGLWGLDLILDLPKKMNRYYEMDIRSREVIYDKKGWPVHPDTYRRVRNIAAASQFSLNVVFFIIYPFALIWMIIKRLCFTPYPQSQTELNGTCRCQHGTLVQMRSSSLQSSLIRRSGSVVKEHR